MAEMLQKDLKQRGKRLGTIRYLKFSATELYKKVRLLHQILLRSRLWEPRQKLQSIRGVFPLGYQLFDRTTCSTSDMELPVSDARSWIGSNTLPNSDGPCFSIGGQTGDSESYQFGSAPYLCVHPFEGNIRKIFEWLWPLV